MRTNKTLKPAVSFARANGFVIETTGKNHLRYKKSGHRTVYSSQTPSDKRAVDNLLSDLNKSLQHRL